MNSGMTTTATGKSWTNRNIVDSAWLPVNGKREKLYAASAANVNATMVVAVATTTLFWNQAGNAPWISRSKLSSVGAVGTQSGGLRSNWSCVFTDDARSQ